MFGASLAGMSPSPCCTMVSATLEESRTLAHWRLFRHSLAVSGETSGARVQIDRGSKSMLNDLPDHELNEARRRAAESHRDEAEELRRLAEDAREARERRRELLEATCVEREELRLASGSARVTGEQARVAGEAARSAAEETGRPRWRRCRARRI
jgi:hypothetical protein